MQMIFAMVACVFSVAALVITAAGKGTDIRLAYVHMAIAAAVTLLLALISIRETRSLIGAGAGRNAVAASKVRGMGFIWTWGTLALVATYGTGILQWKEWWQFTIPFVVLAVACLFVGNLLDRATAGEPDEGLLRLMNILGKVQLAGMLIAIVGLLVDGKMTRFMVARHGDWAANNYFFFGAVALAALSLFAISKSGQSRDG
jgi:hypothetical protein